jgi:uncharacterized membrane protein
MIILAIVAYLIIAGIVCGIVHDGDDMFEAIIVGGAWGLFIPLLMILYLIKLVLILPFRLGKKIKTKLNIKL